MSLHQKRKEKKKPKFLKHFLFNRKIKSKYDKPTRANKRIKLYNENHTKLKSL